jgi:dipeptidyl aminopeptidase/acylaminoacyl peptidase
VYYSNNESGIFRAFKKAANGLGEEIPVYGNDTLHVAFLSRSPDGRFLYGARVRADWNIIRFDTQDTVDAEVIVGTPYTERAAAVSPDGKYLAYYGNESGQHEVYVLELAEGGGRWQISSAGGRRPEWSADGKQLYYFTPNWDFVAVPISTAGKFTIGSPKTLFNKRLTTEGRGITRYAVTKDPNKFIMAVPLVSRGGGEFTVVVNWLKAIEDR